jgi:hypothetical protein
LASTGTPSDNRALTKLIFGGGVRCDYSTGYKKVPLEPAALEVGMTEADFSNKNLGAGGAIIIAGWLTHKDMGALTMVTFGDKQVVTMTTEMTEADFSGKLGSYESQIVAAFLPKCM